MPPTNLVGAFLKYGKLEAAEPCGAVDQCNPPTKPPIQFSKKFIFDDIEWTDDFLDPGIATTIEKMDEISEMVNCNDPPLIHVASRSITIRFFKVGPGPP